MLINFKLKISQIKRKEIIYWQKFKIKVSINDNNNFKIIFYY